MFSLLRLPLFILFLFLLIRGAIVSAILVHTCAEATLVMTVHRSAKYQNQIEMCLRALFQRTEIIRQQ